MNCPDCKHRMIIEEYYPYRKETRWICPKCGRRGVVTRRLTMTDRRPIDQIDGAVALSQRRQNLGKQPGANDKKAMRKAYHEDQLPKALRKEIEKLARGAR